jgi:hypothetical protein
MATRRITTMACVNVEYSETWRRLPVNRLARAHARWWATSPNSLAIRSTS